MPPQTLPAAERVRSRAQAPAAIEWREAGAGDGSYTFLGHAAVFDTWTTLYEGRYFVWREQVAPGAFRDVLASRPDVHLNVGHDSNLSIARTGIHGIGELDLNEDERGLRAWARLDGADPTVQALAPKLQRGIMDQMSFAFMVGEDEVRIYEDAQGREVEDRTIHSVSDLIDVCVCARGAYPTTDASLRGHLAALDRAGRMDPAGPQVPHRADAGAADTPIAPADPAGGDALTRLKARSARRLIVLRVRGVI